MVRNPFATEWRSGAYPDVWRVCRGQHRSYLDVRPSGNENPVRCRQGRAVSCCPLLSPSILLSRTWLRENTRFLLLRLMLSGMISGIVLALHGRVICVSPLPTEDNGFRFDLAQSLTSSRGLDGWYALDSQTSKSRAFRQPRSALYGLPYGTGVRPCDWGRVSNRLSQRLGSGCADLGLCPNPVLRTPVLVLRLSHAGHPYPSARSSPMSKAWTRSLRCLPKPCHPRFGWVACNGAAARRSFCRGT